MSKTERRKGSTGEREVRMIYEAHGFTIRGLEGGGDHLAVLPSQLALERHRPVAAFGHRGLAIHSEVKRQELARPWQWWEQAERETPAGALTVVAFRRNHSPWLALANLDHLLAELAR